MLFPEYFLCGVAATRNEWVAKPRGIFRARQSRKGKSRLPHFLWVLNAVHFRHLVWRCNKKLTYKREPSQAKRNNQVPNQTTTCWKLFRILAGYSAVTSVTYGHLGAIKNCMLQKRWKNSLKCQILSETKQTGNQCWNALETHRPHDLSTGKDIIRSVKTKNPPQHTPPIFLRYPVTLFHGQIIRSQIILLLDFFVSSSTI